MAEDRGHKPPESEQEATGDAAEPQVFALRREQGGWQLSRRGFLAAAAGATLGAAAAQARRSRGRAGGATDKTGCSNGRAHTGKIHALAVSSDGKWLASGGADDLVKLWSLPNGGHFKTLKGHSDIVHALCFTPDSGTLASGGSDQTVRLWSLPTGKALGKSGNPSEYVFALVYDGEERITGGKGKTIQVWSPEGQVERTLEGHTDWVWCLALSREGLLASGSKDCTIRLWYASDGECLTEIKEHTGAVRGVAISRDGRTLASGSEDKTVRLWSLPDGTPLKTLEGHHGCVTAVAISPDGSLLASASADKTVKVWSLPDGQLLKTLSGHKDWVNALAISPNGKLLASASDDQTIRLWRLPDGKLVRCLLDLKASTKSAKGLSYRVRSETGGWVTYTLPCGSPIPAGATCVCNCVPGSLPIPHVDTGGYGGGYSGGGWGTTCTCNMIHYWYPN